MSGDSHVMRSVLAGSTPSPEQFEEYYREFHADRPGATERGLAQFIDDAGRTSYDRLADAVLSNDVANVLDIGCGDGALLERLIARAPRLRVSGIDLTSAEIDRALARLPAANVERLVTGRVQAVPFDDATFDAVTSHMVLMLVPDAQAVVHEVRRVLKPGGVFVSLLPRVSEGLDDIAHLLKTIPLWVREHHPAYAPVFPGDPRVMQRESLEQLLETGGFTTTRVDDFVISRNVSSKDLFALIEHRYYIGSLPVQTLVQLRERIEQWAENRTLTFHEAMRIIVAR